jgi:cell wall-associated NlpC family hydrolase
MKKSLLLLALAAPSSLVAQSRTMLSPYVAADGSVQGSPVMVGATLSKETGWVGMRAGGAVDAHSAFGSSSSSTPYGSAFAADLDGLLFAGSPTADHVVPFALLGVGGRLVRPGTGTEAAAAWSYGAGARMPVMPWLSIEGELRHSQPFTSDVVPGVVRAGWAVRFGANVRISGGSAPRPVTPAPVPLSIPRALPAAVGASSSSSARAAIAQRTLDTADDYLGTRYTWGGNTPDSGFDCSGFVRFVFAREGIDLPRVSRDQARVGEPLPLEVAAFEPGDLLAFASRRGGEVDHIAIYVGNTRINPARASGHEVRFDDLGTARGSWYLEHMVAARRVIGEPTFAGLQSR